LGENGSSEGVMVGGEAPLCSVPARQPGASVEFVSDRLHGTLKKIATAVVRSADRRKTRAFSLTLTGHFMIFISLHYST
jgi:hypothetical protein